MPADRQAAQEPHHLVEDHAVDATQHSEREDIGDAQRKGALEQQITDAMPPDSCQG